MAGLSTSLPMRVMGWAAFCLLATDGSLWAAQTSAEVWSSALASFEQSDGKQACRQTQTWIETPSASHSNSPEAHHNLAVCSWMQKEPDTAVYGALTGLNLQNSIPKINSELRFISSMQRELGIQNSVTATTSFLLASVATPLNVLILISVGFWMVVYRKIFLPQAKILRKVVNTSAAMLIMLACSLFLNRMIQSRLAVLFGEKTIAVYNFTNAEKPTPLAELPRGTLVVLGRERPGYIQILEPVPGWVPTASMKAVNRDL